MEDALLMAKGDTNGKERSMDDKGVGETNKKEQVTTIGNSKPISREKRPNNSNRSHKRKKCKKCKKKLVPAPVERCQHCNKINHRSEECWKFQDKALVSTLPDLVSTHCPKTAQKVVMRNQTSRMGQGKSDEHPPYE
ncbi:hypothetical protein Taro_037946 [Colocasia esculenta]|uniref:Uncharacterized protein n=1 Tax=Colocasia esculenta TaxID=4460 RepID=A0A843WBB0_COLES|nr:hypothetical protein [Colocasia esculenta]